MKAIEFSIPFLLDKDGKTDFEDDFSKAHIPAPRVGVFFYFLAGSEEDERGVQAIVIKNLAREYQVSRTVASLMVSLKTARGTKLEAEKLDARMLAKAWKKGKLQLKLDIQKAFEQTDRRFVEVVLHFRMESSALDVGTHVASQNLEEMIVSEPVTLKCSGKGQFYVPKALLKRYCPVGIIVHLVAQAEMWSLSLFFFGGGGEMSTLYASTSYYRAQEPCVCVCVCVCVCAFVENSEHSGAAHG